MSYQCFLHRFSSNAHLVKEMMCGLAGFGLVRLGSVWSGRTRFGAVR